MLLPFHRRNHVANSYTILVLIAHLLRNETVVIDAWSARQCHSSVEFPCTPVAENRRTFVEYYSKRLALTASWYSSIALPPYGAAADVEDVQFEVLFHSLYPSWSGTTLPLLSLHESVDTGGNMISQWPMGRWPDPILRRPADMVGESLFGTSTLSRACEILAATARSEGAVGLAAQQCGINARIIFLEKLNRNVVSYGRRSQVVHNKPGDVGNEGDYMILINPRIVQRSPEQQMKVWTEECLVLPPSFRAIVLRDYWVQIEYQDLNGSWKTCRLFDDIARAAQHELDHDRGILLTDHVSIDEMENVVMKQIEQRNQHLPFSINKTLPNRNDRIAMAYNRYIDESVFSS